MPSIAVGEYISSSGPNDMGKTSKSVCRFTHFGYLLGSYSSTLDVPFYQCGHRVPENQSAGQPPARFVGALLGVPALSPTVRACQAQPSFLEHRFSLVRRSREWHLGSPADAIPPYGRVLVWVSFCFCFPLSRTVCCPHAAEVKEEPSQVEWTSAQNGAVAVELPQHGNLLSSTCSKANASIARV